jgi:hypothetical protein
MSGVVVWVSVLSEGVVGTLQTGGRCEKVLLTITTGCKDLGVNHKSTRGLT